MERSSFTTDEKIYCFLRLYDLAAGSHEINSHWINPAGEVEQANNHTFSLKKRSNYTYYAWISLMKNGPFKRMLTGSDVDRKYKGPWQIRFLLDGNELAAIPFEIR